MLFGVKLAVKVFTLFLGGGGGGVGPVRRMYFLKESPGGVSLLIGALWSDFLGLPFQK